MTLLLQQFFNLIKLLNSETGSSQIAFGIVLGMILGFSPGFSLQSLLVMLILFFFRIQIGAALIAVPVFKLLAFFFDPLFHKVGGWVLELPSLRPTFTTLYNMPIVPFSRFNNSVVMGAGIMALLLSPLVYLLALKLVATYRVQVMARFENTAFWKALKATSFYKWYVKYEALRG